MLLNWKFVSITSLPFLLSLSHKLGYDLTCLSMLIILFVTSFLHFYDNNNLFHKNQDLEDQGAS